MANLVQNPSFELSTPPSVSPNWVANGTVDTVNNSSLAHSGNNFCFFDNNGLKRLRQVNITVTAATQYVLSFWANPINAAADLSIIITGSDLSQLVVLNNLNTYTQYSYVFTTTGTSINLIFVVRNGNSLRLDDISITENVVCYRGDSKILVSDHEGSVSEISVKDIVKDEHTVFSDIGQKFIPIVHNAVTGPYGRFRMIPKDLLRENCPSEDTYFTSGHKIIHEGYETKVKDVPGAVLRRIKPENIYTIVTEDHDIILVNNMPVVSYSKEEWDTYNNDRVLHWYENSK